MASLLLLYLQMLANQRREIDKVTERLRDLMIVWYGVWPSLFI